MRTLIQWILVLKRVARAVKMSCSCAGLIKAMYHNKFQSAAVAFGVGQMTLIALYLAMYVHPPDLLFVSDLLYRDTEYMVLMSVCVGVQMVFCICYAYRHRKEYPMEFRLMGGGLLISAIGWVTLNSNYLDATNDISDTHIAGVVMFVTGDTVYFVFVVRDSWLAYWNQVRYLGLRSLRSLKRSQRFYSI